MVTNLTRPRKVKPTLERKKPPRSRLIGRRMVAKGWILQLNRYRVSVWDHGKVLETDGQGVMFTQLESI